MVAKPLSPLLAEIGECIACWNVVEEELTRLFMLLHRRSSYDYHDPLRAAFEAVISLEVRLAMIVATVRSDADAERAYASHIGTLYNSVTRKYKDRHKVAHFALVWRDRGGQPKLLARPFFKRSEFESNTGPTEMDEKRVTEIRLSFLRLATKVTAHVQHVGALKDLSLEWYVQAGDPAHDTHWLSVPNLRDNDTPPQS